MNSLRFYEEYSHHDKEQRINENPPVSKQCSCNSDNLGKQIVPIAEDALSSRKAIFVYPRSLASSSTSVEKDPAPIISNAFIFKPLFSRYFLVIEPIAFRPTVIMVLLNELSMNAVKHIRLIESPTDMHPLIKTPNAALEVFFIKKVIPRSARRGII